MRTDSLRNSRIALAATCFAAMTPAASAETWTLSTLHNDCTRLQCKDGADPRYVAWDPAGNLFGTANLGGSERLGTIFELSPPAGR